jgi:hypothetical protein
MRSVLVISLLLVGCATQKATYLPDGRKGHAIDCSGVPMTWGDCYAKAGSICKTAGYEIISKEGESSAGVAGTRDAVIGSQSYKRSLVIACK